MSVRRVCDRCGKGVETGLLPKQLVRKGLIDKWYDLCPDCYAEFDEWMEGRVDEPDNTKCKDEWTKKFSINSVIKVKLTDYGKDIYLSKHDKYLPGSPNFDTDGLTKFQLCHFIQIFGPHIGLGMNQIIENNELYMYEGHFGGLEDRYV